MANLSDPQWIVLIIMVLIQIFLAGKAWGGMAGARKELAESVKEIKGTVSTVSEKLDNHLTGANGKHHFE